MKTKKVLLIEDDQTLRAAIETFLKRIRIDVVSFSQVDQAVREINDSVDIILSDVMMPGLTGYDLLSYVSKNYPHIPIILMTGHGSIEKAVEVMKKGAYDFLVKPFSLNVLETALNAAFLDRQTRFDTNTSSANELAQGDFLNARVGLKRVSERFISNNPKMREIIENLKRIAPSKATVLIQGESGTGKELIAKMIHEFSPRSQRIFVAINCAAMPDTLLESELFGHEKGAFTGAVNRQIGKFELSNNGTILLDEISEMSLTMQTKLLRVLQECEIYRVGGVKPIALNLRVVATTNRDLFQYTKDGNFREDLYYRINVIPIVMPPLRERGDDVVLLAGEFLKEFAVLHGREVLPLEEQIKKKIKSHPWYGNVRELRNAMERAVLVGDFDVLNEAEPPQAEPNTNKAPVSDATQELLGGNLTLGEIEKRVILKTLESCEGNRTKTAQKLGISLRTLRNKLKSYEEGGTGMEDAED
ncbi:sigma-54 dependent transcriptional regulator [bacterium]|nr:sigma-54 dependent transcriptional regulator [bacterium]